MKESDSSSFDQPGYSESSRKETAPPGYISIDSLKAKIGELFAEEARKNAIIDEANEQPVPPLEDTDAWEIFHDRMTAATYHAAANIARVHLLKELSDWAEQQTID